MALFGDRVAVGIGAAVLRYTREVSVQAPVSEQTPLGQSRLRRQNTFREAFHDQMQQRAQDEVRANLSLFCCIIIPVIGFGIYMLVAFILALVAAIKHCRGPCDYHLGIYLWVSLGWWFAEQYIMMFCLWFVQKLCINLGPRGIFGFKFFASAVPGWIIIGWGIYMVSHCKTCQADNPGLYYPTRLYIYSQVASNALDHILSICLHIGIVLLLSKLRTAPGCKDAVYKLPKVPIGSAELVDTDGQLMNCPICQEDFDTEMEVVQCPCKHLFHTECLATWCSNHLDCPLCREQVGPIERV